MQGWVDSYRTAFRQRALQLLAWAHRDSRAAIHSRLEEEEITQLLVSAMRARLVRIDLPDEFVPLDVHEDQPHSSEGRTGKRRRRIDIVVRRIQRGPRPTYSLEAKRLGAHSGSLSSYMGADGLGLFVSGAYAAEELEAAMLGYVQQGDISEWANRVRSFITDKSAHVTALGAAEPITVIDDLEHICRSRHGCPQGKPIDMLHVFLDCSD